MELKSATPWPTSTSSGEIILITRVDKLFLKLTQTVAIHKCLHCPGELEKPLDEGRLAEMLAPLGAA